MAAEGLDDLLLALVKRPGKGGLRHRPKEARRAFARGLDHRLLRLPAKEQIRRQIGCQVLGGRHEDRVAKGRRRGVLPVHAPRVEVLVVCVLEGVKARAQQRACGFGHGSGCADQRARACGDRVDGHARQAVCPASKEVHIDLLLRREHVLDGLEFFHLLAQLRARVERRALQKAWVDLVRQIEDVLRAVHVPGKLGLHLVAQCVACKQPVQVAPVHLRGCFAVPVVVFAHQALARLGVGGGVHHHVAGLAEALPVVVPSDARAKLRRLPAGELIIAADDVRQADGILHGRVHLGDHLRAVEDRRALRADFVVGNVGNLPDVRDPGAAHVVLQRHADPVGGGCEAVEDVLRALGHVVAEIEKSLHAARRADVAALGRREAVPVPEVAVRGKQRAVSVQALRHFVPALVALHVDHVARVVFGKGGKHLRRRAAGKRSLDVALHARIALLCVVCHHLAVHAVP